MIMSPAGPYVAEAVAWWEERQKKQQKNKKDRKLLNNKEDKRERRKMAKEWKTKMNSITLSTSREVGRPVTGRPSWLSLEYSIPISADWLAVIGLPLYLWSEWVRPRVLWFAVNCLLAAATSLQSDTSCTCRQMKMPVILKSVWQNTLFGKSLSSGSSVCPDWLAVHCTGSVLWQQLCVRPDRPSTAATAASTDSWSPVEEGDI